MAKQPKTTPNLLRWSDHVPASDVQDPLGLGLRGSARLASRLLYCITSITPRARYFAFLPWSVYDFQQREKGKPFALGLREAIVLREQALTLGCVAHHDGEPCQGGALVGSRKAGKWYAKGEKQANFREMYKFAQDPALDAYFNSLVNLGFFLTEQELPDTDERMKKSDFTFDDIQLSELGLDLAKRYNSTVGTLSVTSKLGSKERSCSVDGLAEFGKHGGLCELTNGMSSDRDSLRDIFFAGESFLTFVGKTGHKKESHVVRRRSLLLILEVCRQLSADKRITSEAGFSGAVYFGEVVKAEDRLAVTFPSELKDIATRWRMFYFHHYMAVALEGLFSWFVSQLGSIGLAGSTLESLMERLDEATVHKSLSEVLQVDVKASFGSQKPSDLFSLFGLLPGDFTADSSAMLDKLVRSMTPLAEDTLESVIRRKKHLYSPTGLAIPLVLLVTTLARYTQWEATKYGQWLASAASDPYVDLVPPVLTLGLSRQFGCWWRNTWKELARYIMSKYVMQQHQSMSFEKTRTGDRCLLQWDGQKVFSTGGYDKIGMGNPRLESAIQILKDVAVIEDNEDRVTYLTQDGKQLLRQKLAKEVEDEVS
jgi:hypothetical protein